MLTEDRGVRRDSAACLTAFLLEIDRAGPSPGTKKVLIYYIIFMKAINLFYTKKYGFGMERSPPATDPYSPTWTDSPFQRLSSSNRTSQRLSRDNLGTKERPLSAMIPPRRKSDAACANWVVAASQVHKSKHQMLVDSKGRGADEWKQSRREYCRWMFYSAMSGIGTAMWADYVLFIDHQEPSSRSIMYHMNSVCSIFLDILCFAGRCPFSFALLLLPALQSTILSGDE